MSGLEKRSEVFEIGEVIQFDTKGKEFCKRTGIRICHIKHNVHFMKIRINI
jgi:hypothetical protein